MQSPRLPREMKKYEDPNFEFRVRDITAADQAEKSWAEGQRGVLVEAVREGGWAALGHLADGDLLLEIDGTAVADVEAVQKLMAAHRRNEAGGGGAEGPARDPDAVRRTAERLAGGSRQRENSDVRSARRAAALALAIVAGHAGDALVSARRTTAPRRARSSRSGRAPIVNVRVVLKMRVSVGGREMQSMDESVETVGTVIDPSGLTVLSLGALNPGAMMNKMMGGGGSGQERMEFGSEPTRREAAAPGRQGAAGADRAARRGSRPGVPAADRQAGQAAGRHQPRRRRPPVDARSGRRPDRASAASAAGRRRRRCRRSARSSRSRARST